MIIDCINNLLAKFLTFFAALAILCLPSVAQNNTISSKRLKHDVSFGIGYGVLMAIDNNWSDQDDDWKSPTLQLQYMYNVSEFVSLGLTVNYSCSSFSKTTKELVELHNEQGRYIGAYRKDTELIKHTNWFTFSPTARAYWFKKRNVAMYSRMSIGIVTANGHDTGTFLMPTFSPIAVEAGESHLWYFFEPFSIGTYGFFNSGIKYTF